MPVTLLLALLYAAMRKVLLVGVVHGTIDAVPLLRIPPDRPWVGAMLAMCGFVTAVAAGWLYRRWALYAGPDALRVRVEAAHQENEQPTFFSRRDSCQG
jgi:hypothetical protein